MTDREMAMALWEMVIDKALKNGIPFRMSEFNNMTWEEAECIIDERIMEKEYTKQKEKEYNRVDNRIKRKYKSNQDYYESIGDTYSMNQIMDAYNESREYGY